MIGLNLNFPNIFEVFLFNVVAIGIFFSSLNLNTEANLKSMYSSIWVISSVIFIYSFLKFIPNVTDSPASNESPKANRLEANILLISILLDPPLLFFMS